MSWKCQCRRISPAVRAACVVFAAITTAASQSNGTVPSQMLTITGNAGIVSIPDSPSLTPTTGFTVEAWFYFDPSAPGGSNSPTILRKPASDVSYLLRTSNPTGGTLEFYVNVNNSNHVLGTSEATPQLSWHHVAGTYDGAVARFYVDGVLKASKNIVGTLTPIAGPLVLGRGHPNSETWRGSIDGVRLWSVARSAAVIAAESRVRIVSAPSLVSSWYFDGTYNDSTGTNHPTTTAQVALQPSTSPIQTAYLGGPATVLWGGVATFACATAKASSPYVFDVGFGGSAPGLPLPPPLFGSVPLNFPWVNLDFGPYLPPEWFSGFVGVTDAFGGASASFALPAIPGITGLQMTGALMLLDPAAPYGLFAASNPHTIVVVDLPPGVSSVAPTIVSSSGGGALTITGSGFGPGASVTIGGTPATNVVVTSSTSLTCVAPPKALGAYDVAVTMPGPTTGVLPAALTYVAPIVITGVAPPSAAPGTPVAVTGSGFDASTSVTVNGAGVLVIQQTTTSLTFLAPFGAPCGTNLTATSSLSGLSASTTWNAAPNVTSITNATGPATGGSLFNVSGTGFAYGTSVSVGGSPASIIFGSSTLLQCIAPPGSTGPATVVVASPTGCTTVGVFTYL